MLEVKGTDALLVSALLVLGDLLLQRLDLDLQEVFLLLKVAPMFLFLPPVTGKTYLMGNKTRLSESVRLIVTAV